jgi:RES domain-containing protein
MRLWRICKERHVADALSGEGARRTGGRWNHKGDAVVYTSTSLSLASLELFVHLEPNLMPDDLYSIAVMLPESSSAEELPSAQLPSDWRDYPPPAELQEIGSQWIHQRRSLALIVPSAVNPEEKNVLLNPLHPYAATLETIETKPFQFDPRMWKGRGKV